MSIFREGICLLSFKTFIYTAILLIIFGIPGNILEAWEPEYVFNYIISATGTKTITISSDQKPNNRISINSSAINYGPIYNGYLVTLFFIDIYKYLYQSTDWLNNIPIIYSFPSIYPPLSYSPSVIPVSYDRLYDDLWDNYNNQCDPSLDWFKEISKMYAYQSPYLPPTSYPSVYTPAIFYSPLYFSPEIPVSYDHFYNDPWNNYNNQYGPSPDWFKEISKFHAYQSPYFPPISYPSVYYSSYYSPSVNEHNSTAHAETQNLPWSDTETGVGSIRASEGNKYIVSSILEAPNLDTTYSVSDDSDHVITWMDGKKLYARLILITYYQDADKDNFGNFWATLDACSCPSGYVENSEDCDDSNPNIHPEAKECADGIDNNCNGQIDEGCGDINEDGIVNNDDYILFRTTYSFCNGANNFIPKADIDCDSCVTINDYRLFRTFISL